MRCDYCNKLVGSSGADAIHTCTPPAIVQQLQAQLAQAQRQNEANGNALWEAEAQVAALKPYAAHPPHCTWANGARSERPCDCGVLSVLANLPVAAEKLLAAQRVAEACDVFRKGDAQTPSERVADRKRLAEAIDAALEVWSKAGGSNGQG